MDSGDHNLQALNVYSVFVCLTHRQSQNAKVSKIVDEDLVEELLTAGQIHSVRNETQTTTEGSESQREREVCPDLRVVVLRRYSLV